VPCVECGRTFRADRIAKHTQVCRTTAQKLAKRKVFDVGKQRIEVLATALTVACHANAP
jgi:hypothetical protein